MQAKSKQKLILSILFKILNTKQTIFIIFYTFLMASKQVNLQCVEQCVSMRFYGCTICYSNCTYNNQPSDPLVFKSCKQINCTKYGQQLNRNCQQFTETFYNQSKCLQTCCNSQQKTFSMQVLSTCLQLNQQSISEAEIQKIIVIVSVVVSLILCCLACLLCSKYHLCLKLKQWIKSKCTAQPPDHDSQIIDHYHRQIPVNPHFNINYYRKIPLAALLRQSKWTQCSINYINPDDQCSICLQNHADCLTFCNHSFHFQCFVQWINKKSLCPICNSTIFNPIQLICRSCHQKKISISIDSLTPQLIYCDIKCPSCQEKTLKVKKRLIQMNISQIGLNSH